MPHLRRATLNGRTLPSPRELLSGPTHEQRTRRYGVLWPRWKDWIRDGWVICRVVERRSAVEFRKKFRKICTNLRCHETGFFGDLAYTNTMYCVSSSNFHGPLLKAANP